MLEIETRTWDGEKFGLRTEVTVADFCSSLDCPRWACPSGAKDWPLEPGLVTPFAFSAAAARPGPGGGSGKRRTRQNVGPVVANPTLRWGKPSGGDREAEHNW